MLVVYKMEVGQRIKEVRLSMDLTQEKFCLSFGPVVSNTSMLSKYESGETTPPLKLFLLLAREGINLNWLFTGEGEMYISTEAAFHSAAHYPEEIPIFRQIHNVFKEGDEEKIKTIESLLNILSPRMKKIKSRRRKKM